MTVVAEVPASKFKLNPDPLPPVLSDPPFGLAIWKASSYHLDHIAKFMGNHAEQEDNTLLVYRGMKQTTKAYKLSEETLPSRCPGV